MGFVDSQLSSTVPMGPLPGNICIPMGIMPTPDFASVGASPKPECNSEGALQKPDCTPVTDLLVGHVTESTKDQPRKSLGWTEYSSGEIWN